MTVIDITNFRLEDDTTVSVECKICSLGNTAWMTTADKGKVPKDFRRGDIALNPNKKEVLIATMVHLADKKKLSKAWEIRRLGKQVEFTALGMATEFHMRVVDAVL
ncbi:MAG TPA: hypothetical protein ENH82_12735 [bacterium]|nr:hypothetical protein [bacterium]